MRKIIACSFVLLASVLLSGCSLQDFADSKVKIDESGIDIQSDKGSVKIDEKGIDAGLNGGQKSSREKDPASSTNEKYTAPIDVSMLDGDTTKVDADGTINVKTGNTEIKTNPNGSVTIDGVTY